MKQTRGRKTPFRRRKVKGPYIKLSRGYVEKAVDEYLKGGGTITVLEGPRDKYEGILSIPDVYPEADDFLLNK